MPNKIYCFILLDDEQKKEKGVQMGEMDKVTKKGYKKKAESKKKRCKFWVWRCRETWEKHWIVQKKKILDKILS